MDIQSFTGGIFETNCYFFRAGKRAILIDAPEDAAMWLADNELKPDLLLLTHGHLDHVVDAARIQREYGCQVGYHADGIQMLTEPGFFRKLGFDWEIEPVTADILIDETASLELAGVDFQVCHVPGHCPGSLCFFWKQERILFGGDVLFAGGVGRWDLPGGNRDLLFSGIKTKLFPLGDDVRVLPGHGPSTTIGHERTTNPYLA